MYCKNCGKEMNDNQAICLECGYKAGDGDKHCANCGSQLAPNAAVCLNCGVATKKMADGGNLNGKDKLQQLYCASSSVALEYIILLWVRQRGVL